MSKVDAQRAMKAARHARTSAAAEVPVRRAAAAPRPTAGAGASAGAAPTAPATPAAAQAADSPAPAVPAAAVAVGLCGHRNMAGKECRRAAGHAEKSHRYA